MYILLFIILVISIVIAVWYPSTFWGNFSIGFLTSMVSTACLSLPGIFKGQEWVTIKLKILSFLLPKAKIRFSFSYLYRIEIDDKFLLTKNIAHGNISPAGGVYKYYESANEFLRKINCNTSLEMDVVANHQKYEKDLRIIVKLCDAPALIRWFQDGTSREYCPTREFDEELNNTGLIPANVSSCEVFFEKHKTCKRIRKSSEYYKFHWFDVFIVKLTDDQKNIVKSAIERNQQIAKEDRNNMQLFLATSREIENGRLSNGLRTGDHTACIL
jgi:hypothetical protein